MVYKTVAFDGLSLAGKSTMVQMLFERSINAEVVRENVRDPYRPLTSRLNKLLKDFGPAVAVEKAFMEFPGSGDVLHRALDYASGFSGSAQRQALLAHMFTQGRRVVDDYVRQAVEERDIILDRWQMTGWAYQVDSEGLTWHDIRRLNEEFGILVPDIQVVLTCPVEQIPARKAYREKQSVGTAGQMSGGREQIIRDAFLDIYKHLSGAIPVYLFENAGTPARDLEGQIRQAIPIFREVERVVRSHGFRVKDEAMTGEEAFWLNPERLCRIYERQTK